MMRNFFHNKLQQQGFTLVEMIVVIVITGIIGGMVAMFIRAPVEGYADSARRAEMSDVADTALRRISRDLRMALPNSVRVAGGGLFLEFIPTTGGGRYRSEPATAGPVVCGSYNGAVLNFGIPDNCFEVLGPMPQPLPVLGDQVIIFNFGIPGADAYAGNTLATHNRRAITAVGANSISIASINTLPLNACQFNPVTGTNTLCRFRLVNTPVTYACDLATGTLTRYWGYAIQALQTSVDSLAELNALVAPANATRGSTLLATNVSACNFTYNPNVVAQRLGVVTMALTITQPSGVATVENVSLFSATQVNNAP